MTKYNLDFSEYKTTEAVGTTKDNKAKFIQIETERDAAILTFTKEQWFFITNMLVDELDEKEKEELISRIL